MVVQIMVVKSPPLPPLINLRHRPTRQTPMIGYGNCATPFLTHPIPLFPLHYF